MKVRIGACLAAFALGGTIVTAAAAPAFAKPLSSGEFKKQANAICKEGNQQLEAAAEQAFGDLPKGQQPSPEQLETFASVAIPNIKAKVKKLITSARAAVAKIEANPSLLGDEKNDPFAATDKQAKKLGLKECASDSGS